MNQMVVHVAISIVCKDTINLISSITDLVFSSSLARSLCNNNFMWNSTTLIITWFFL